MQRFVIPVATLDKVMNYLGTRPFVEVAPLIQEIQEETKLIDDEVAKSPLPPAPDSDE